MCGASAPSPSETSIAALARCAELEPRLDQRFGRRQAATQRFSARAAAEAPARERGRRFERKSASPAAASPTLADQPELVAGTSTGAQQRTRALAEHRGRDREHVAA